jgi:hypothetical protein
MSKQETLFVDGGGKGKVQLCQIYGTSEHPVIYHACGVFLLDDGLQAWAAQASRYSQC